MSDKFTKEDEKELNRLIKKKTDYEKSKKIPITDCVNNFFYRDEPQEELIDDLIDHAQELIDALKIFLDK